MTVLPSLVSAIAEPRLWPCAVVVHPTGVDPPVPELDELDELAVAPPVAPPTPELDELAVAPPVDDPPVLLLLAGLPVLELELDEATFELELAACGRPELELELAFEPPRPPRSTCCCSSLRPLPLTRCFRSLPRRLLRRWSPRRARRL